jgi:alanine racemase
MQRYRSWVEVDSQALSKNIAQITNLLDEPTDFCAVVKANAYGHGLMKVAKIAHQNGVNSFAVDHIDDALQLREVYPDAFILVMGYTMHNRLSEAIENNIHLITYDVSTLQAMESAASKLSKTAHAHLKIETGTSRQGILIDDLEGVLRDLSVLPHVEVAGVSTHFANIEDTTDTEYAGKQLKRFNEALEIIRSFDIEPERIHCACSAAIILYPDTHFTMVRAGIAMYGIWPSNSTEATARKHTIDCDLTPALTWKTRIAQVKSLPAGTPISYGLTERLKRDGRVAILPTGYWDGYDRKLSSKGKVLINGESCKVLGRVCMNMTIVDVSHVPNIQPEDTVILLGQDGRHRVTANNIAELINTIPYEVVSRINPDLPRRIV